MLKESLKAIAKCIELHQCVRMALTLRLPEDDEKQLKLLAESVGLMPIDLVRAAVKGLLIAAKSNQGKIELPLHVRTKAEEAAWASICRELTHVANEIPADEYLVGNFFHLVDLMDTYAATAYMPQKVERSEWNDPEIHSDGGFAAYKARQDAPMPRKKKPTK
jgi:hypothetical protein